MNHYQQTYDRSGWHTATVLTAVLGVIGLLISGGSLVGIFALIGGLPALAASITGGFISHRVFRAILFGFAALSWLGASFVAFWSGLVWAVFLIGLIPIVGSWFLLAAAITALVEMVRTINRENNVVIEPPQAFAQPAIIINNNANAQLGHHQQNRANGPAEASTRMQSSPARMQSARQVRISVMEGGRQTATVMLGIGEVAVIGREASARVHVSDAGASRRHAEVTFDGISWTIRDLGSLNPTQLIEPTGHRRQLSSGDRLPYGQLAIGQSVITLHPPSRQA